MGLGTVAAAQKCLVKFIEIQAFFGKKINQKFDKNSLDAMDAL